MAKLIRDIKLVRIDDLDGINTRDYPDFVDAYATSAYYTDTGEELTDAELDELNGNYSAKVYDAVIARLF